MYHLLSPIYLMIASLMCLYFATMEYIDGKGKIDYATTSLLCSWCITSLIVASIVAGVSAELTYGVSNGMHLIIALMAVCISFIVSSLIISYS